MAALHYKPRFHRRGLIAAIGAVALSVAAGFGGAPSAIAQLSADDRATIDDISDYLNSIETMTGEFLQIAPDGDISEGVFYIRRPGRMRFEYAHPNPTLVVADGFWVAVIDKRFESTDRFPVRETPLNLILKGDVDLNDEEAIRSVERRNGQLRVRAVDPETDEQGDIVMVFDTTPFLQLRQWIVTDPQGLPTTIALRTAQQNVPVDASLFVIPDELQFNDD